MDIPERLRRQLQEMRAIDGDRLVGLTESESAEVFAWWAGEGTVKERFLELHGKHMEAWAKTQSH